MFDELISKSKISDSGPSFSFIPTAVTTTELYSKPNFSMSERLKLYSVSEQEVKNFLLNYLLFSLDP